VESNPVRHRQQRLTDCEQRLRTRSLRSQGPGQLNLQSGAIVISRSIYSHLTPDLREPTRYAGLRRVFLQRLPDSTIAYRVEQSESRFHRTLTVFASGFFHLVFCAERCRRHPRPKKRGMLPLQFELAETVRACGSLGSPFRVATRLLKSARERFHCSRWSQENAASQHLNSLPPEVSHTHLNI
jgi:hypothetical protein